ncbi:hypothetical protein BOX15_Mlig006498g2, partial [Macrostomum lignano]
AMSLSGLARARCALTSLINQLSIRFFPPSFSPALAAVTDSPCAQHPLPVINLKDEQIRLAVPKRRRTIETRATRRITRFANIVVPMMATARVVSCPSCGNRHERGVLCPLCYERIRDGTDQQNGSVGCESDGTAAPHSSADTVSGSKN